MSEVEETIAAAIRQVNDENSEFECRIVCGCRCSAMCANAIFIKPIV